MQKQEVISKAISYFDQGYACSQSVLLAFAPQFKLDENTAKLISSTFGGGMGRLRDKCGALTGGFMVLGLAFGNLEPKDMDAKLAAYKEVRKLNQLVEDIHGTTNCAVLLRKHATETEVADRKHHNLICKKVVEDTVGILYDILNKA